MLFRSQKFLDSNGGYASMITYMLFYISMNLGTFACIVLFGLSLWVYQRCMYGILASETCMGCNGDHCKFDERGGSMIEGLDVGSGFLLKGGGFVFSKKVLSPPLLFSFFFSKTPPFFFEVPSFFYQSPRV